MLSLWQKYLARIVGSERGRDGIFLCMDRTVQDGFGIYIFVYGQYSTGRDRDGFFVGVGKVGTSQ